MQRACAKSAKGLGEFRIGDSPSSELTVYVGPIAAGEKVVTSKRSDVFRFIRDSYGDALAVEMEGVGFLGATYANSSVRALIVRGIFHLIDRKSQTIRLDPKTVPRNAPQRLLSKCWQDAIVNRHRYISRKQAQRKSLVRADHLTQIRL